MADQQRILQFLTTEHFTLATAKAAVVNESNGRATIYLSTLSSAIVALAFIGQVSKIGTTFMVFGLALFLPLFFLGLTTFTRCYETANESMRHARRINRIRHYYVEVAPEMAPYFERRTHDDMDDFFDELAIDKPAHPTKLWGIWQQLISITGAIAVINSMLAGVFAGFAQHAIAPLPLSVTVVIGLVTALVGVALHVRYMDRRYARSERQLTPMFPNDPKSGA